MNHLIVYVLNCHTYVHQISAWQTNIFVYTKHCRSNARYCTVATYNEHADSKCVFGDFCKLG